MVVDGHCDRLGCSWSSARGGKGGSYSWRQTIPHIEVQTRKHVSISTNPQAQCPAPVLSVRVENDSWIYAMLMMLHQILLHNTINFGPCCFFSLGLLATLVVEECLEHASSLLGRAERELVVVVVNNRFVDTRVAEHRHVGLELARRVATLASRRACTALSGARLGGPRAAGAPAAGLARS